MLLFTVTGFIVAYAQVGINNPSPQSTLDIVAKNPTGASTNVDGVLISRVDRLRAQNMQNVPISTLIYVNNITTGSAAGIAANINAVGYYYYDGTAWVKLHNPANTTFISNNIYTSDGLLSNNRIVNQGANTLSFTANALNAFSVNGTNFSVDAANRRVGIGSTSPSSTLFVTTPFQEGNTDAFSVGIKNCGVPCGGPEVRTISLYNENPFNPLFARLDFIPSITATGISGASITGIDRDVTNNYAGLQFWTRNSTGYGPRMTLKSSGDVGIGTTVMTAKLNIGGDLFIATTNTSTNVTDIPLVIGSDGIVKQQSTDTGSRQVGGRIATYGDFTTDPDFALIGDSQWVKVASGTNISMGNVPESGTTQGWYFGSGYTVRNTSPGTYLIDFTTAFTEIYGVTVNIWDTYQSSPGNNNNLAGFNTGAQGTQLLVTDNAQIGFISNTQIMIKTGDNGGNRKNRSFTFVVSGR